MNTKQGEEDEHYKKGGDEQYTGIRHIQNVSIPLLIVINIFQYRLHIY